jgi:ABC-type transport system substrate-binding protein
MTRLDRAVTALLIAVLVVAGGLLALPRTPAPAGQDGNPSDQPSGSVPVVADAVYREGVVGVPSSITPITARSRSDRTLVGLIFSGLVKLGPGSTLLPDLASRWTVDKTRTIWTVTIRPDATWQDGAPVTAEDAVFTVNALKDSSASGALAASWAEVTAEAVDDETVRFTLATPIAGFLAALTQPLVPAHLLGNVAPADLAASDFAANPVGSGPYAIAQIDNTSAVLVPFRPVPPSGSSPSPGASASASASAAPASSAPAVTPRPTRTPRPTKTPKPSGSPSPAPTASPTPTPQPTPAIPVRPGARPFDRIELSFFATDADLAAALRAGTIDAAAGLPSASIADLATTVGTSVVEYPTTTLSAVILNLRTTHPELRDANVRRALLEGIDRASVASNGLAGGATVAQALVPPSSWAYDPVAVGKVAYDRTAAAKLLSTAHWTRIGGRWAAPSAKAAYQLELLTVSAAANPRLAAVAAAVRDSWTLLGFRVTVTELSGTDLAARLRSGKFTAALLDVSMGLDPDLYPLLASSQVQASGSNLSGYQDTSLDVLIADARAYATVAQRKAAWSALETRLAAQLPILPIVWADDKVVVRGVQGITPRLIAHPGDRFWDVLAWRLAATP